METAKKPPYPNRIKELRLLRGHSLDSLAAAVGTSNQQISKLELGQRRLTDKWMRRLSGPLNVSPADLMEPSGPIVAALPSVPDGAIDVPAAKTADLFGKEDLPVYSSIGRVEGMIINQSAIIERVSRPGPLFNVAGAYGVYVTGDEMRPKYRHGDLVLLHPTRPVREDEHVLAYRKTNEGVVAVIGLLKARTSDAIVLEQYNPPREVKIVTGDLHAVHLIVGSYEHR